MLDTIFDDPIIPVIEVKLDSDKNLPTSSAEIVGENLGLKQELPSTDIIAFLSTFYKSDKFNYDLL